MRIRNIAWVLGLLMAAQGGWAQTFSSDLPGIPPKHEFRGAWIATISQLDWPRGSTPTFQQNDLRTLLDGLQDAGINAVFFQIRPEADALYASDLEPWSQWLTGAEGQAPDPLYDPLAFAVEEARTRGMELHAWMNPFRSVANTNGFARDSSHVSNTHPEWHFTAGTIKVLDPGQPDVRNYVTQVVMDVVRRYDIDGIHFDDYFYPYPPNQITNQDDSTFARFNRGFTNVGDWRRDNVNLFMAQVADSIRSVKPDIAFGVSPFGIWKNGVPTGIVGLDAFNAIYADPLAWLEAGTVDYLIPQLYWAFGGGQDYAKLAPWWGSEAEAEGRHLYVGHAVYKFDQYASNEIPRQIRFNREREDIQGSVFFRARQAGLLSPDGITDSLKIDLNRLPSITPPMAWKNQTPPDAPVNLSFEWTDDTTVTFNWRPPVTDAGPPAMRYALYRIRSIGVPEFGTAIQQNGVLIAVTTDTFAVDAPGMAPEPYYYVVTTLSRNSIDSTPSNFIRLDGRAVANEADLLPEAGFTLHQSYPNPFTPPGTTTTFAFTLDRAETVSVRIYDQLGRLVRTLTDNHHYLNGTHRLTWDGTDEAGVAVASGTYLYTLETETARQTQTAILLR